MRRVKFLWCIFSFLLIIGLFGCGKKTSEDDKRAIIKVAYWGSPEEIEIINTTINNWQKAHPDIKVILEHTPYSGYVSKILTRIAGRAAPDIICSEVNLFPSLYSKDIFLDLSNFIKDKQEFNLSDFFPEVVKRFTVDGKVYGIPRDTAPFACIYYNKKLFNEAGVNYPNDDWNLNEFLDKAQRLTIIKGGKAVQYGFYGWAWQNFVYSNGGSIVDDVSLPTKLALNEPEALAGLQFYVDLMYKYKVMPSSIDIKNVGMGATQMFIMGKIAMFSSGIWETPLFRKIKDFDWDVAMFPKGLDGKRGFGTGGTAYCILKTTRHPKEAWEVLKALAGEEGQVMLAESGLAQPANQKIAEGIHWAESLNPPLNKQMLNEAVKYAVYEPFHPQWREAQELYINPELDLVFNGDETPKEAMDRVKLEVNSLLQNKF